MDGHFVLLSGEPAIQATWYLPGHGLYGVFNVSGVEGNVELELPDGSYADLLGGGPVQVEQGRMALPKSAAIVRYAEKLDAQVVYSHLLDYQREVR